MELSIYLQNMVRNFSRYNKYTIGTTLRDLSRNIILLIIRANPDKKQGPVCEGNLPGFGVIIY